MKQKRSCFFLPFSSFNLFLSFAIASSETVEEDNILVFPAYCEANEKIFSYLQGKIPVFSDSVRLIRGRSRETFLTRPFRKKQFFESFNKLLNQCKVDKIFVFNDLKYQTQFALTAAARLQPEARRIYVEDGTADYTSIRRSKRTWLQRSRDDLLNKGWWMELQAFGTHPLLQEYRFLFPEHARGSGLARVSQRSSISNSGLPRIEYDDEARRFFGPIDAGAICSKHSILVLQDSWHHVKNNPQEVKMIHKICEKALAEGKNVLFKSRNREVSLKTGLEAKQGFFVLPPEIPSEFFFLLFRDCLCEIFGGKTSALMSARWLVPEIPCISVSSFMQETESQMGSTFRKIGIHSYSDEVK